MRLTYKKLQTSIKDRPLFKYWDGVKIETRQKLRQLFLDRGNKWVKRRGKLLTLKKAAIDSSKKQRMADKYVDSASMMRLQHKHNAVLVSDQISPLTFTPQGPRIHCIKMASSIDHIVQKQ